MEFRVFTVSPKSHRVQCKIEDPFSAGRLASTTFVEINDLRRKNLQHRDDIPLAAVGVKMFIY